MLPNWWAALPRNRLTWRRKVPSCASAPRAHLEACSPCAKSTPAACAMAALVAISLPIASNLPLRSGRSSERASCQEPWTAPLAAAWAAATNDLPCKVGDRGTKASAEDNLRRRCVVRVVVLLRGCCGYG